MLTYRFQFQAVCCLLFSCILPASPASGQSFALLSDRTRLALGQTQLYGSQLWGRQESPGWVVPRLEDPDGVDARRAALGMMPLEQYLDLFRAQGQEVLVEAAEDGEDPAG